MVVCGGGGREVQGERGVTRDHCLYSNTTILAILLYSDTTTLTILRWPYYRKVPQRHLRVIYTSTSIICGRVLPTQKSEMKSATNC